MTSISNKIDPKRNRVLSKIEILSLVQGIDNSPEEIEARRREVYASKLYYEILRKIKDRGLSMPQDLGATRELTVSLSASTPAIWKQDFTITYYGSNLWTDFKEIGIAVCNSKNRGENFRIARLLEYDWTFMTGEGFYQFFRSQRQEPSLPWYMLYREEGTITDKVWTRHTVEVSHLTKRARRMGATRWKGRRVPRINSEDPDKKNKQQRSEEIVRRFPLFGEGSENDSDKTRLARQVYLEAVRTWREDGSLDPSPENPLTYKIRIIGPKVSSNGQVFRGGDKIGYADLEDDSKPFLTATCTSPPSEREPDSRTRNYDFQVLIRDTLTENPWYNINAEWHKRNIRQIRRNRTK